MLAYDLKALRTQPPADVSAMDGYAVRAADVANAPARLESHRRGRRRAGRSPPPSGRRSGAHLYRRRRARRRRHGRDPGTTPSATAMGRGAKTRAAQGRHVRPRGLDFRARRRAAQAKGHRLTARDLALAAGMNHPLVPVYRRPQGRPVRHRRRTGAARHASPARARSSIPTASRSRRLPAPKAPTSSISASSAIRSKPPSPRCATPATSAPIFW